MATSNTAASPTVSWKQLSPAADPKHGKPCTRSSHGVSLVVAPSSDSTTAAGAVAARLVVYGGETTARTPLQASQAGWICDNIVTGDYDGGGKKLQWRCIESPPPPLRVAHAQAFHGPSQCVYIFGGRAGITMEERAMNDMWKLDCSGAPGEEKWVEVLYDSSKEAPEARSFHQMTCVGDSLYVFGGCSASHGRLADLWRFDLMTQTWQSLGASKHLRGRGGATLLTLEGGNKLGIVAGFAGEETNDGHLYNVTSGKWCDQALTADLQGLRPRSVCVGGSFPLIGLAVVFGGEVDPSAKGHEGAGGFENDIVLLEESTGKYLVSIPAGSNETWPVTRGWSSGAAVENGDGSGSLYVFGGLSGDDTNPMRLDDLWRLDITKA